MFFSKKEKGAGLPVKFPFELAKKEIFFAYAKNEKIVEYEIFIFIKERIGNGNSRESSFAYAKDEKKSPYWLLNYR